MYEAEWVTRKQRVDVRLRAAGWNPRLLGAGLSEDSSPAAVVEYPTEHGPADYALFVDGEPLAIVEAKRVGLSAQSVLTQAERYGRGLEGSPHDFEGIKVPFLYATNGEAIWFRDVRHHLNRSREVAHFHTPAALLELLGRDLTSDCAWLQATPNAHPKLRPYQQEANTAIEAGIAERKRRMLVAMATGTGKTFTMVNQVYRLMRSGVGGACSSWWTGARWRRRPYARSRRSTRSRG
jgi:type I restriction enzyme R subunit